MLIDIYLVIKINKLDQGCEGYFSVWRHLSTFDNLAAFVGINRNLDENLHGKKNDNFHICAVGSKSECN